MESHLGSAAGGAPARRRRRRSEVFWLTRTPARPLLLPVLTHHTPNRRPKGYGQPQAVNAQAMAAQVIN
jgi:hypothetical protein